MGGRIITGKKLVDIRMLRVSGVANAAGAGLPDGALRWL